MNRLYILLSVFCVVALVQLYVPASMIWDKEKVLETGKEYKFKTAPIDPTDPFRGKYIVLSYANDDIQVDTSEYWERDQDIYVLLGIDTAGFAMINSVSKEMPASTEDYVKAKVDYYSTYSGKIAIEYPFTRYYMEESKAYEAELAYWDSRRDTSQTTYAVVAIKNGDAVIKDVLIDGIPIKTIVEQRQQED